MSEGQLHNVMYWYVFDSYDFTSECGMGITPELGGTKINVFYQQPC